MAAETIPLRVLRTAETRPDDPAYFVRGSSGWESTSWGEYGAQVRQAARAMIRLGLEPGTPVAILGFNRPEWVIFDVAAMAAGGVPAGIYTTSTPDEVEYILNHSEAPLILVENEAQWEKVKVRRHKFPHLRYVITMGGAPDIDDVLVLSWEEFLARGDEIAEDQLQDRVEGLEPGALATLIYTSGTTGPPKGVMLSHDNLTWTADGAAGLAEASVSDRVLSYLPLSHIAEQQFTIHLPSTIGYTVYYAESIEKLLENLQEVQPHLFFAVPRVWEKFQAGVTAKLAEATGVKARIARRAVDVGRRVVTARNQGKSVSRWTLLQYSLFDRLVYSKVREGLGLRDARLCVTSAAPISQEVLDFFAGVGIPVQEVYGQSEDTGPTSANVAGKTKFGTVGQAYPGVEVKIADDGEILVQGRNVFLGYFKDPAATEKTLVDGWLHSGDLGEFDDEGFLTITGRKKDIIITAGGKNIAPKPIEGGLKNHPLISEAVVVGDQRKFLTALVTLDGEAAETFLAKHGLEGPAHENSQVIAEVQEALDGVNAGVARVKQVKKFTVLPREFSIEGGELTPTLKVKRDKVNERFAGEIEAMYAE